MSHFLTFRFYLTTQHYRIKLTSMHLIRLVKPLQYAYNFKAKYWKQGVDIRYFTLCG